MQISEYQIFIKEHTISLQFHRICDLTYQILLQDWLTTSSFLQKSFQVAKIQINDILLCKKKMSPELF